MLIGSKARLASPRRAAACIALAALTTGVLAQQAPPTPGTIQDTIEQRRPAAPGGPPQLLFPKEDDRTGHDRNAPRFQVNGFRFIGNTVYHEARLRRLVERYLDLQLNLFDLNRAADAVTRFYRDSGYPVARAIIPAQRVENGVVTIEVVEGRIGRIRFEGNRRYSASFLAAWTAPLTGGSLVTLDRLERTLLLLNDLPGLTAKATLEPGAEFGTTDAVITIVEKPAGLALALNNSGRKEAGALRLDAGFELYNPLGIGDMLTLRAIRAQQALLEYYKLGYSLPVDRNGSRIGFGHGVTDYKVGGDFELLGIAGTVTNTEFNFTHPLVRSRGANLAAGFGIRRTETRQTALATPVVQGDLRLFTASLAGNYIHEDSAATTASFGFSGNFRNNADGGPNLLRGKYDIDMTHLAGLSPRWDMYLRGNLVASAGRLPDTEKFSLGGADSVRGYRPAELRGDDGYLATVEFRHQFSVKNVVGVLALFHDRGAVRNKGFAGQDALRSNGVGVSLFPSREVRLKLEYARPWQGHEPADGKTNGRVWFTLAASF